MDPFPFTGKDTVWTYLRTVANKKRTFEDPLYAEGNAACGMQLQYVAVDLDEEELECERAPLRCEVAGCGRRLGSVVEQEAHYAASHRHSCAICRARLPSLHTLQLHLEESHDSLFQLRAQRQPMYACFVESCGVLSADPVARRQHCVSEHCFPADFCYSPRPPAADVSEPPPPTVGISGATPPAGRPRLRFSYRVPEEGVSFGERAGLCVRLSGAGQRRMATRTGVDAARAR
ncbi:zinc finger protein 511-like [Pollicipes pollicipes]|uniref:zinc finger protein 511-like n=1 Tax=Pollicipes pollicipes TaxID=41117 RepID=UPI0018853B21|nr:zinc finger protein 511-like [Pollicipes pollicipes]